MIVLFYSVCGYTLAHFTTLFLEGNSFLEACTIGNERSMHYGIITKLVVPAGVTVVAIVIDRDLLQCPSVFYLYLATIGYCCLYLHGAKTEKLLIFFTTPVLVGVFILGVRVEKAIKRDGLGCALLGVVVSGFPILEALQLGLPGLRSLLLLPIFAYYCIKGSIFHTSLNVLTFTHNRSKMGNKLYRKVRILRNKLTGVDQLPVSGYGYRVINYVCLIPMVVTVGLMILGSFNPCVEPAPRRPLGVSHSKGCTIIKKWLNP